MAKPKRKFKPSPSKVSAPRAKPVVPATEPVVPATAPPEPAAATARPKPAVTRPRRAPAPARNRHARPVSRPESPLDRADLWAAGGVGAAAAAVFASTFSSQVALGDAPESVAGVHSLGVLHAPGYVTYVVAARAFGEVFRIGSWALRVNLFSVVCAALTIALLFVVARGFGAGRAGAAIGSLGLATSVAFWFNAGFAKYYAFSSLLLVIVVLCVQRWQRGGSPALLVAAGAITGACLGVSWELAAVAAVGLALMVWFGAPRPGVAVVVATVGATVVTAVAVCGFILVRAAQDPTTNFGNASTVGRLFELLSAADFSSLRTDSGAGAGNLVHALPMYVEIIGRDAGVGVGLLALLGIFDVWDRRRGDHAAFFAVLGLGNLVGVGIVSGYNRIAGFYPGLVMGGQLVGTSVVVALLASLGVTRLRHEIREWQTESRRGAKGAEAASRGVVDAAVVGFVALGVVVPSLVVHHSLADHRMPPLAERYAARVLAQLPRNSVLLTGGYEFGQPIIERQTLIRARPDVTVVALDNLSLAWYRSQLVHRLGLDPALARPGSANSVRAEVVAALRKTRPVYEDAYAMYSASSLFGYQPEGLVGKVVDGSGPQSTPGVAATSAALRRGEEADAIDPKYDRFPNTTFFFLYERAHVELAKADALAGDLDHAADEIERGLRYEPKQEDRTPITEARKHAADAKQIILGL